MRRIQLVALVLIAIMAIATIPAAAIAAKEPTAGAHVTKNDRYPLSTNNSVK